MAYTDRKVDLILNKLTKAQYDKLLEQNRISETELYFITDDNGKYILQGEVYTKEEIDGKLSKFYTQEQLTTLLGGKLDKTGGTITGDLIVNGTITASNISGGGATIDDTQISTSSTYSSSKIDSTYLKAPEGRLNIENGRVNLTNNLNSTYSITNNEVVMELNDDGLRYHDNATNLDVNITPYYGAIDQTVDPATIKVNGVGLARETDLNKKVSLRGDTMTGNLNAPAFTVDSTAAASGDKPLIDGAINFKYKNTNDEPWNAWLTMLPSGQLQFGSQGAVSSEIGTVATQQWVNKKITNAYIYKGSVDTYDALPSSADPGFVYNVRSNGANYAWTGTEWDELGATVNLDGYALKTEIPSLAGYATESWVEGKGYLTQHQSLDGKQDKLISGTNIKTINGTSILGEGNIVLSTESGAGIDDSQVSTSTTYSSSKIDTTYAKSQDVYTKDEVFTKVEINESLSRYDTALPTDIAVDANKMYLYHNGTAISGQTPVEFKTVGGVSIFGSGNIEAGSSGGTNVEANPTLYGSEAELSGIKIGETSYKIPTPDLTNYALKSEIPEKVSDLPNDVGYTKTVVKFVKWEG